MAKTKNEKITSIEEQIRQLENQRKKLLQSQREQERKDRTRRLCQRGGLLESMLPGTIPLSDEQFKSFLEKTVANDFGRRTLEKLAAQGSGASAARPVVLAKDSGADEDTDKGETARVSG